MISVKIYWWKTQSEFYYVSIEQDIIIFLKHAYGDDGSYEPGSKSKYMGHNEYSGEIKGKRDRDIPLQVYV